jgi:hypothetical protein
LTVHALGCHRVANRERHRYLRLMRISHYLLAVVYLYILNRAIDISRAIPSFSIQTWHPQFFAFGYVLSIVVLVFIVYKFLLPEEAYTFG